MRPRVLATLCIVGAVGCGSGGGPVAAPARDAALGSDAAVAPDAETLPVDGAMFPSDAAGAPPDGAPFAICRELGDGYPIGLALSPDGTLMAVPLSSGRAELRRTSDGALIRTITLASFDERLMQVQFADGARLLAARVTQTVRNGFTYNSAPRVRLFAVEDGTRVRDTPYTYDHAAVSADGDLHVMERQNVAVVRAGDGATVWTDPDPRFRPGVAAFSADGRFLAAASAPWVRVYKTADGSVVGTFEARGFESYFEMVAIAADGRFVAVSYDDDGDGVDVWSVADGAHFHLEAPDESELRFTGRDGDLVINDRTLVRFAGGAAQSSALPIDLRELHVFADGERTLVRQVDGGIRLGLRGAVAPQWTLPPPRGHGTEVAGLGHDPATGTLASVDRMRGVRFWDLRREGALARSLPGQAAGTLGFFSGVFSPDLAHLATVGVRAAVTILRLDDGSERPFSGASAIFSADATSLIVGSGSLGAEGTTVFRIGDASVLYKLPASRGGAAVSGDGRFLATGGLTSVRIHDPRDGAFIREVSLPPSRGPLSTVGHALAFSADNRRLAVATVGNLAVIDPATGEVLRRLDSERNGPGRLALSPDGKLLAVATASDGLGVWQVDTGEAVVALDPRSAAREREVHFVSGARMLVTGDDDGVVRVRCY